MSQKRRRNTDKNQKLMSNKAHGARWPVASTLLAFAAGAQGQQAPDSSSSGATLEEIVVTAEKRVENLQNVPLSIQALGTAKLEELHVTNFTDYAQFLPTVSFQSTGPGFSHAYMRGVAAINNINHSGPSPSVGVYMDEQPITTIDGELDAHIYDIERVEALAGPQGTLYGASSEAGTVRIITNKPDPAKFSAAYDLDGNTVNHGDAGYAVEGYVNLPISDNAAVRLVGWDEKKAGYINNIPGTLTWSNGTVSNNAALVKDHYNDVETKGGRAALKVIFDDNWSILPMVMGQTQESHGVFGYNPALGEFNVQHYLPESQHDSWLQSALTVQGKVSNLDITYAFGYLNRNVHTTSDYTDYSFYYNSIAHYFVDNAGNALNPDQLILGRDNYTKISHELRIATPKEYPLRFVGGLFYERQVHEILQDYLVPGLATLPAGDALSVTDWPGAWWLTKQERTDRDEAVFGELSYDLTSQLTLTVGDRYFRAYNSLQGFYGFGLGNPFNGGGVPPATPTEGEATCFNPAPFQGAPCQDLNGQTSDTGNSPKVNLTYKFDDHRLVYATYSKGFRPGGINRAGGVTTPPYKPDYLSNYELGWKTTWFGNQLRFNGAIFQEDWKDFQFSFLGPNALTIIQNAGQARIQGIETDLEYAASHSLTLSGGFTYLDARLKEDYCGEGYCPTPEAPYNSRLPVTPRLKADFTGRYTFDLMGGNGFAEAALAYVGDRLADLRSAEYSSKCTPSTCTPASSKGNPLAILGTEKAYTTINVSAGLEKSGFHYEVYISNLFDVRGQLDRYAECDAVKCGLSATYIVPSQPRTIGIKFGEKF